MPQASGGRVYRPRQPRATALYQCAARHAPELKAGGRYGRRVEENVIERFLACGDPQAARARSTWARLIHKVYEVDPLECPRCKGPMRVIALIDDAAVIRKILSHLGLWAPQPAPRTLVGPSAHDPPGQSKPVLTYHPVPDIA